MKNRRLGVILVFSIIGVLVIAAYGYHESKKNVHEITDGWLLKNKNEIAVKTIISYDPSHEGCDAYCKLHSGDWIEIRVEKGFLGRWKVVHVKEIFFEDLPERIKEETK